MQIRLLGGFELRDRKGGEIALRSKKARALLGYLVLNPGKRFGRERLAGIFWSGRFEAQARQSLRQALLAVRKALGVHAGDMVIADDDGVVFAGAGLDVDAGRFEHFIEAGDLDAAIGLYQGDLLQGIGAVSEPFDAWLGEQRARLHSLACDVLERHGSAQLQAGATQPALETAQQLTALEPLRETGHRLMMQAFAQDGRRAEACRHYEMLADLLKRELDAAPDPATSALFDQIRSKETDGGEDGAAAGIRQRDPAARVVAEPGSNMPSIAVLPFAGHGRQDEQSYFAEGITEDIITALSRLRWLFVISKNSSFAYPSGSSDTAQVAREFGVRYILEGSVRTSAERIRITVQLIDVASDRNVWGERYDRDIGDIFALQDEITFNVVSAIGPEISSAEIERIGRKRAGSLDAWDHYLRAQSYTHRLDPDANARAKAELNKAIEIDPDYAAAYAGLAWCHVLDAIIGWQTHGRESIEQSLQSARAAVALDEGDPRAHCALAVVHTWTSRQDEAERAARRAIELDPNMPDAFGILGYALGFQGKADEATQAIERALKGSPRDRLRWLWLQGIANAHFAAGRIEETISLVKQVAEQRPNWIFAYAVEAACAGLLGRQKDAADALARVMDLYPAYCLERVRRNPMWSDEKAKNTFFKGLKLAGVPD
jgi:TolB-like protein/Flp pilus assembly protein TadD